jgi:hypothetical protein
MSERPINVAPAERLAAGVLAGVLTGGAFRISPLMRLFAIGCLLYRITSGHCYGYEWLGVSTCKVKPRP